MSDPNSPEQVRKTRDGVRTMFAHIAKAYDLNNRLHSLWQDQAWRRATVRAAEVRPGDEVLDAATGTGDLAGMFAETRAARVVGLDLTPEMLEIARKKFPDRNVEWLLGDAMQMPFADASFDVVSVGFGLRNMPDAPSALKEFRRVLRPGGRLVVLEFSGGRGRGILDRLARWYVRRVMPWTAGIIASGRPGAYDYLPRSIDSFYPAQQLVDVIRAAGFADVRVQMLSHDLVGLFAAVRPE